LSGYTYTNEYTNWHAHFTYTCANCNTLPNRYTDHSSPNSYRYCYFYSNGNGYRNGYSHAYGDVYA
jgi:hypothetical protein